MEDKFLGGFWGAQFETNPSKDDNIFCNEALYVRLGWDCRELDRTMSDFSDEFSAPKIG